MPANKIRSAPVHATPPKGSDKKKQKKKPKPAECCPVCGNTIIEEDEEQGVTGDDALFCEGQCNTWIHRTCLGLNNKLYQALTEADDPYLCPHCLLDKQAHELNDLRKQVKTLTDDLAHTKNQLKALENRVPTNTVMNPGPLCLNHLNKQLRLNLLNKVESCQGNVNLMLLYKVLKSPLQTPLDTTDIRQTWENDLIY